MKYLMRSVLMICVLGSGAAHGGSVLYVHDDASPGGDGASWNTAFRYLQDAIAMANEGDEIRIGPGHYRPDQSENGHATIGNRDNAFSLTKELTVRGGYAGPGAPDPDDYNPLAYQTVLSGDLLGDDGPNFTNMTDNSKRVIHVHHASGPVRLEGLIMRSSFNTSQAAGGLRVDNTHSIYLRDCSFEHCVASLGACAHIGNHTGYADIRNCGFNANKADAAISALFLNADSFIFANCTLRNNEVEVLWPGAMAAQPNNGPGLIVNCEFVGNKTGSGPAAGLEALRCTVVNCVFMHNEGSGGAGAFGGESDFINCVFYENVGGGLSTDANLQCTAWNCVFRGNQGGQIVDFPLDEEFYPVVRYCNVEGGWPGTGNIDADPMFVQPGTRNFRLAHGSPCVDAGYNDALPPDWFDLDDDGDTDELLPVDLGLSDRIQGTNVDMGAYEGEFDMLPLANMNDDVDPGEFALLSINSAQLNREESIVVFLRNLSGRYNSTVVATDLRDNTGRTTADAPATQIDTDVPEGEMVIRMTVPFTADDLNGSDPLETDLTIYDPASDTWKLASALNMSNSPGHDEPIGDRHVVEGASGSLPPVEMGDYGVFWNPTTQHGYVWSTTDHPGVHGVRFGSCPGDSLPYGGDHVIDVFDLIALLTAWNTDARWSDTDGNGVIDAIDLVSLITAWGDCRP